MKLVHPAGLSPADSPFEAEDDCNFTTDAEMGPTERLALSWGKRPAVYKTAAVATEPRRREIGGLPRTCTVFGPGKSRSFTIKVCNPSWLSEMVAVRKDRDT